MPGKPGRMGKPGVKGKFDWKIIVQYELNEHPFIANVFFFFVHLVNLGEQGEQGLQVHIERRT